MISDDCKATTVEYSGEYKLVQGWLQGIVGWAWASFMHFSHRRWLTYWEKLESKVESIRYWIQDWNVSAKLEVWWTIWPSLVFSTTQLAHHSTQLVYHSTQLVYYTTLTWAWPPWLTGTYCSHPQTQSPISSPDPSYCPEQQRQRWAWGNSETEIGSPGGSHILREGVSKYWCQQFTWW